MVISTVHSSSRLPLKAVSVYEVERVGLTTIEPSSSSISESSSESTMVLPRLSTIVISFVRVLSHESVTSSPELIEVRDAVNSQRGELEPPPPPPPPPPVVMLTAVVHCTELVPFVAVRVKVVFCVIDVLVEPSTATFPMP
jgi:hypothetical protein